jgi:hypothetical protein
MLLDEKQVTETLHEILREFARPRHYIYNCKEIKGLIEELGIIIMVYLMNENVLLSIKTIVAFDQSDLEIERKRIIISLNTYF